MKNAAGVALNEAHRPPGRDRHVEVLFDQRREEKFDHVRVGHVLHFRTRYGSCDGNPRHNLVQWAVPYHSAQSHPVPPVRCDHGLTDAGAGAGPDRRGYRVPHGVLSKTLVKLENLAVRTEVAPSRDGAGTRHLQFDALPHRFGPDAAQE